MIRPAILADLPFLWEMLYESAFVPVETRDEWRRASEPPPALGKYLDGWGRRGDAGVVAADADSERVGAAGSAICQST